MTEHRFRDGQRTFKLSINPQTNSRFIQLPTEIRTKILRLLLKQPGCITPLHEYRDASNHVDGSTWANFFSQILGTCQILDVEGEYILYQENTVSICFNRNSCTSANAYRFGADRGFNVEVSNMKAGYGPILQIRKQVPLYNRLVPLTWHYGCVMDTPSYGESDVFQILKRFKHLQITFFDREVHMIASRWLKNHVKDKHVTISLGQLPEIESFRGLYVPDQSKITGANELASLVAVWKCSSLRFERLVQASGTSRLKDLRLQTARKTGAHDLVPDMVHLENMLSASQCHYRYTKLSHCYPCHAEREQLWDAVRNNDIETFKSLRWKLLTSAKSMLLSYRAKLEPSLHKVKNIISSPQESEPGALTNYRKTWLQPLVNDKEDALSFKGPIFGKMLDQINHILKYDDLWEHEECYGLNTQFHPIVDILEVSNLSTSTPRVSSGRIPPKYNLEKQMGRSNARVFTTMDDD